MRWMLSWLCLSCLPLTLTPGFSAAAELRVGAAKVDITPDEMPVLINGGMTSRSAQQVTTRIYARAIVVEGDQERIGICVVDSCMLPKHLCDEAKQLTATRSGLAADKLLISATHTHTAPSSMGALGTDADATYVPFLRQKLADAFVAAEKNLQPARVGWGSANAPDFTALRRWILRPDRVRNDPFGNPTVRATMHAASSPEDAIGPTGPEDPELSLIAFQTLEGQPLAVLCNFSMHYFGGQPAISADYFGYFCEKLEQHLDADGNLGTVAVMSHGCSGDIWRRDYMQRREVAEGSLDDYTLGLLSVAQDAYRTLELSQDTTVAMQQRVIPMRYRVPDAQRLAWAQGIVATLQDRLPQTQPEIYAREQIFLDQLQHTEVVLQAIRIGDMAIASTPNETYALTGLKLKLQSPYEKTMVIELANGGDGYIPPPEQHELGGYNTWAARSAGLEETAEPRIVANDLVLLEQVCDQQRRSFVQPLGPAAQRITDLDPTAYWRCHEFARGPAQDSLGHDGALANYESGVVFFLEGPPGFGAGDDVNRCVHFAGGRMLAQLDQPSTDSSLVLSFWNGMPADVRDVTGWLASQDRWHTLSPEGVHIGLDRSGRLLLQVGDKRMHGKTVIDRWTWHQLVAVQSAESIRVWLAGQPEPEIDFPHASARHPTPTWAFGGRSDNLDNWEGKLDEIALFDRALSDEEIATLFEH